MVADPVQFIDIYSTAREPASHLPPQCKMHKLQRLQELSINVFAHTYSLVLLDERTSIPDLVDFLSAQPKSEVDRLRVIYSAQEFSESEVLQLSNLPQVFRILERDKSLNLADEIKNAVDFFKHLRETDDLLGRVRVQNKILNELNENLEQIVDQRTEHLENSKKEIELKTRDVRDLIKFIKSLSMVEGFEDLILILRHEFIKYHKVRPPILVYSLMNANYRCVYFQGQQIVDRPLVIENQQQLSKDPAHLREILANTMERPISPVTCIFLNHEEHNGVFVFEHSMDALEQKAFMSILDRRTESLTIAFDRLALKWKAHQISKQWSTTFDFLQDPIVIVDSDYNIIRSNKKFALENQKNALKVNVAKEVVAAQRPGPTSRMSVGNKIYEVHVYPIYLGQQERFANMIIHYADVTQATHLQGRLIQSEKMSAIGLLAGNIAHELNNPLTGIKSLAQILLTEVPASSPVHSDLAEIQAAAERSELIIKNLLEFSSLHAHSVETVSVRGIITKTMPFLKTALRYHNSFIELEEGDDFVVVEPHLLQQVIFNLVNNACQAMGDEGDLSLESKILPQAIEIRVRDTGPGIPLEIRESIFTPFFTTKEEGQGTGLGLSMSRSIIEKFGGKLFLNESLQKGSEFIIHLPRKLK